MGRTMQPAGVRALHGSKTRPRHRDRLEEAPEARSEAIAPPATFPPPAELTAPERRYWDQFAPLLALSRILTPADVETLADYARACAALEDRAGRLRTALAADPFVHGTVSLLDRQLRGWMDRKTKLAAELGLTAVSRTRIGWSGHAPAPASSAASSGPPAPPPSTLARLQAQATALRRPIGVGKRAS